MKQNTINILLGIAGLAGLAFGLYGLGKANMALDAYATAVDSVTGKVTIDPPAAVVKAATEKAMNGAIDMIAKAELQTAKKELASAAANGVANAIEEATKSIDLSAPEIKAQIVKGAGEKVGVFVVDKLKNTNFGGNPVNGDAAIIKACTEAGIRDSWDIRRVLEASKK